MGKNKILTVCADDFGMNAAANAAILALAEWGRLSSASCLVDGPVFVRDAALLKGTALQTGLHLNFTDDFGQTDRVMPINKLIVAAYLRLLNTSDIQRAVARQLDSFEKVMGRAPDYIDGHLHVHQLPVIRDALLTELEKRYGSAAQRPWLRSTKARHAYGLPLSLKLKAAIIQTLGSAALVRRASRKGFTTNAGFLGVYGFTGGARAYSKYMQAWLGAAEDGDVLMCHPECGKDTYDNQRRAEYDILRSTDFAGWLATNSLQLR